MVALFVCDCSSMNAVYFGLLGFNTFQRVINRMSVLERVTEWCEPIAAGCKNINQNKVRYSKAVFP